MSITDQAELDARRARYAARKAAGLCTRCGAGLQETDLTSECVECVAAHAAAMARYYTSEKGRQTRNAEARRRRARLVADGKCAQCARPNTDGAGQRCAACTEMHRVYNARYLDRKEAASC